MPRAAGNLAAVGGLAPGLAAWQNVAMRRFSYFAASVALLMPIAAMAGESLELHVGHASIVADSAGQRAMQLELTSASSSDFAAFTGRHVGATIDLRVDGEVLMSPRLMDPITGGKIMVSGSFARGELEAIAKSVSAAAAKVEVEARDP